MKTLTEAIFSFDVKLESEGQKRSLSAAVEELPTDQKIVLTLHFNQQIPVSEISRQLNCSATTTYTKLNRALFTLRNKLNPVAYKKMYSILYPDTGKPASIS
jgi:RNA polymerase sigma factor (sigma-70 family)